MENINILDYFETKINPNSPAGKYDERPWNFCKLCDFKSLQGHGKIGGMANQSIKIHIIKKHNIKLSETKWIDTSQKETKNEMKPITCKLAKFYKFNENNPKKDFACKECRIKAKKAVKKLKECSL